MLVFSLLLGPGVVPGRTDLVRGSMQSFTHLLGQQDARGLLLGGTGTIRLVWASGCDACARHGVLFGRTRPSQKDAKCGGKTLGARVVPRWACLADWVSSSGGPPGAKIYAKSLDVPVGESRASLSGAKGDARSQGGQDGPRKMDILQEKIQRYAPEEQVQRYADEEQEPGR